MYYCVHWKATATLHTFSNSATAQLIDNNPNKLSEQHCSTHDYMQLYVFDSAYEKDNKQTELLIAKWDGDKYWALSAHTIAERQRAKQKKLKK